MNERRARTANAVHARDIHLAKTQISSEGLSNAMHRSPFRASFAVASLLAFSFPCLGDAFVRAHPRPSVAEQKEERPVDFSLLTPDGKTVTAADARGKVTLLFFIAKGIPLVREALIQLRQVAERNPQVNIYLIVTNGVRPKDQNYLSDADILDWVEAKKLSTTILRDPNGATLFKKLGLAALPGAVILKKDGTPSGLPREGLDPNGKMVEQLKAEIDRAGAD